MKTRITASLVAAAMLIAPLAALADNHEADLSSVWIIKPKQGMAAEFEKALGEHAAMRSREGDSRDWQVYSVALGYHMGVYQVRHCCFDWADQDAYEADNADKGFGEHFQENVAEYVDHMHHYFEQMDMENSFWPDDIDATYYGVTSWKMKQGASPEAYQVREEFSKVASENGWGEENPWLWLTRIGGEPTLMIVSPYDNYADMKPPEQEFFEFMVEKTGMEADEVAAMFQTFGSAFTSEDYTIWRSRPDLSVEIDE